MTGATPGITLAGMHFPLNPDFWTDITIASPNTTLLTSTKAMLDATGRAQASLNVPRVADTRVIGRVFHHAYLVYDAQGRWNMVSNPVSLTLVK